MIATDEGVIKVWGIRRPPEGLQLDDQRIKAIKESPKNRKLDSGEDCQHVEMRDGGTPCDCAGIDTPRGLRTG